MTPIVAHERPANAGHRVAALLGYRTGAVLVRSGQRARERNHASHRPR
ncbi:hypothetical protein [Streptomyces flavidovirens]|nr:hypothetical protein [Streptomyces flavidovirens]